MCSAVKLNSCENSNETAYLRAGTIKVDGVNNLEMSLLNCRNSNRARKHNEQMIKVTSPSLLLGV